MKIWLKTIREEKITADGVYEITERLTPDTLTAFLRDKLSEKDIPTPVILPVHIQKMLAFNIVRFKQDDFVEWVDFDTMVIEVFKEKKENAR